MRSLQLLNVPLYETTGLSWKRTGWLLIVLSVTAVVSILVGQWIFYPAYSVIYFLLMLPVGLVLFLLAVVPTDLSGAMVPAIIITFYAAVWLLKLPFSVLVIIIIIIWCTLG